MCCTTRLLGLLAIVGWASATEVLAGKPAPPPPPPDPAIVVMGMAVRTSANLFVMNADGSNLRLLLAAADSKSLGGSNHRQPSWSPDGAWVFFASDMPVRPDANPELEGTGPGIYRIHRSGSPLCKIAELNGKLGSNVPHEAPVVQFGWNGSKIVYVDQVYDRPCSEGLCEQLDVFLVDATCGAPAPVNLTRSPSFNESGPTWSPDALRIAVAVSDSAGAPGAWVSVCDLNGEQQLIEHRVASLAVVAPGRLEQRDRLGDGTPVAAAYAVCHRLVGWGQAHGRGLRWALICSSTSLALAGIGVPGP